MCEQRPEGDEGFQVDHSLEGGVPSKGNSKCKVLRQVHGGVQEAEGCNSMPGSKRKTGVESEKVYRVTLLSCTL